MNTASVGLYKVDLSSNRSKSNKWITKTLLKQAFYSYQFANTQTSSLRDLFFMLMTQKVYDIHYTTTKPWYIDALNKLSRKLKLTAANCIPFNYTFKQTWYSSNHQTHVQLVNGAITFNPQSK